MSNNDELTYKLVQALLVWKQQGAPAEITISDATAIAKKKNPGITEPEMVSIVRSSNSLEIKGDKIILNSQLQNLL